MVDLKRKKAKEGDERKKWKKEKIPDKVSFLKACPNDLRTAIQLHSIQCAPFLNHLLGCEFLGRSLYS